MFISKGFAAAAIILIVADSILSHATATPNTTGLINFNNSDSETADVYGPYAGNNNAANVTVTAQPPTNPYNVTVNTTINPLYTFSATPQKTIDIIFLVAPHTGPYSDGNTYCEFEIIYSYQGSINGGNTNLYYPNTYATPVYPANSPGIPTCYAQASGPQLAYPSTSAANFQEFFKISGL